MMIVGLATCDTSLRDSWRKQLRSDSMVVDLSIANNSAFYQLPSGNGILICDLSESGLRSLALWQGLAICVGEPGSQPYEQTKVAANSRLCISYNESLVRLRDLVNVVSEANLLLVPQSAADMRLHPPFENSPPKPTNSIDSAEVLDFAECALEAVGERNLILVEVRRLIRKLLRPSSVRFFIKDGNSYISDCRSYSLDISDKMVLHCEKNPTIMDGLNWPSSVDQFARSEIQGRMVLLEAKLVVPVCNFRALEAIIMLSSRQDGFSYTDSDRICASKIARIMGRLLEVNQSSRELKRLHEHSLGLNKLFPSYLVLEPGDELPRLAPAVVKDLIGRVRRTGGEQRILPGVGQPFRARAALDIPTQRIYAYWENCMADVRNLEDADIDERSEFLKNLALSLNHELGNALVPFAVLEHGPFEFRDGDVLGKSVKNNIKYLTLLNARIAQISEFLTESKTICDIREVVKAPCSDLGVNLEVGPEPVLIGCFPQLFTAAVSAVIEALVEARDRDPEGALILKVDSAVGPDEKIGLISLRGRGLRLAGVLPDSLEDGIPTQGKVLMLIVREIIKLHKGSLQFGPGIEGCELWISIKSV